MDNERRPESDLELYRNLLDTPEEFEDGVLFDSINGNEKMTAQPFHTITP